jgi:hypothetical protein
MATKATRLRKKDPGFFEALKLAAAEIERKVAAARLAARQIGKEIALVRDRFGTLKMVFIEPIEKVEHARRDLISTMRSPASARPTVAMRDDLPAAMRAWPAPGFALPVRGYLTRPTGYAAMPRTRPWT